MDMGISFEKLKHPSQSPLFLFRRADEPGPNLPEPNSSNSPLCGTKHHSAAAAPMAAFLGELDDLQVARRPQGS
jgi:hypothetical protein